MVSSVKVDTMSEGMDRIEAILSGHASLLDQVL